MQTFSWYNSYYLLHMSREDIIFEERFLKCAQMIQECDSGEHLENYRQVVILRKIIHF